MQKEQDNCNYNPTIPSLNPNFCRISATLIQNHCIWDGAKKKRGPKIPLKLLPFLVRNRFACYGDLLLGCHPFITNMPALITCWLNCKQKNIYASPLLPTFGSRKKKPKCKNEENVMSKPNIGDPNSGLYKLKKKLF